MIKQVRIFLLFPFFLLPVFLLTCGIDKFYYLPQVSQGDIRVSFNTSADISLSRLSNNPEYSSYSPTYSIFYRIYISNALRNAEIQQSDMSTINSALNSDYSAFYSLTDPTNYSALTTANTFKNRNYHELELDDNANLGNVLENGGSFKINFPQSSGDRPSLIDNSNDVSRNLFRNSGNGNNNGLFFTPEPDRYFFYSAELIEKTDIQITSGGINNDLVLRNSSKDENNIGHAYVSMYIVAVGVAPDFSRVLSKPTHIGVFKLPDLN